MGYESSWVGLGFKIQVYSQCVKYDNQNYNFFNNDVTF